MRGTATDKTHEVLLRLLTQLRQSTEDSVLVVEINNVRTEIPPSEKAALLEALQTAADGTVTTGRAAELLGLSRPTIVRLVDDGVLSATVPGTKHRRLLLSDVLRYGAERKKRRQALDEMMARPDSDELYELVDTFPDK